MLLTLENCLKSSCGDFIIVASWLFWCLIIWIFVPGSALLISMVGHTQMVEGSREGYGIGDWLWTQIVCVCVCVCYCKIWLIDGEQRGLISSRRQFLWLLCLGTSVSSHYKDKHPLMQLKLLLKTGHEDGIYADH